MTFLTYSAIVSAAIVSAICLYLVWDRRYEDGIVGRFALAGLALNGVVFAWDALVSGASYELLPTTALSFDFLAIFMIRHAWRFRRWSRSGVGDWVEGGIDRRVRARRGDR